MCVKSVYDMVYVQRSEDNLWKLVLAFHYVDPRIELTQVVGLDGQLPLPNEKSC